MYSTVTQRVVSDEPVVITIQPGEEAPDKPKPAAMSELVATGLEKSYRKRKVVSSLSISIGSGEVVGLLGPNGAGKTTAFYMIVGLVPCDGGRITLDGEDITRLPMHARARRGVGYLPQEPSIFRS